MTGPMNSERANAQPSASPRGEGCNATAAIVVAVFLIVIASAAAQLISYSIEQTLFEGSLGVPDLRLAIAAGYAGLLSIALGGMTALVRAPRGRGVLRTWFLAAVLALLFVPIRLFGLTDFQMITLAQIVANAIFLLGLVIFRRRFLSDFSPSRGTYGLGLALLFAFILLVPWVLWGSLGSLLDTLLGLAAGLLLGVNAALIYDTSRADVATARPAVAVDGFVMLLELVILSTGMGQNNEQWLLAYTVPILSWAAVSLIHSARMRGGRGWPSAALLLGLAAAWVLVWVDPDELALVTSSGAGELTEWVGKITLVVFLIAFAASFLSLILNGRTATTAANRAAGGLALLVLLAAVYVYFNLGQPGFYGERLFVILKDQADVSGAAGMKDDNQRRAFVYQTLVQHADTTQAHLRSELDGRHVQYKPYYLVNALEVTGDLDLRVWLESQPEVDRVLSNPELRPLPEPIPAAKGIETKPARPQWNLTSIGADRVWAEFNVRGQGVIVGQSDSGAQGDHPELADSYRGQNGQNDYNWLDPWNGSTSPVDTGGHGTHTLGSILGDSTGVAPDAQWIGCVNLARNLGNPAYYLDCMQFMLAPYPQQGDAFKDGDPSKGAMVLNNSWGCPVVEGCDPTSLEPAVAALRDAGVFVVVSAGNSGYGGCSTVTDPPSIYGEVYSVGAVDESGSLADFSSKGPVTVDGSGRTKPDIAAPGVDVLSAYPNSTYETTSGTSMAGPHVVGVVALMWSANPALIGDIERTTQILDQTARPYRGPLPNCAGGTVPNNAVGYGLVDAYAAVQAARQAGGGQ